jgi:hypothetical protein
MCAIAYIDRLFHLSGNAHNYFGFVLIFFTELKIS